MGGGGGSWPLDPICEMSNIPTLTIYLMVIKTLMNCWERLWKALYVEDEITPAQRIGTTGTPLFTTGTHLVALALHWLPLGS
jgi:hypothetical protein